MNTTTLLLYIKILQILYQIRRGQVKPIIREYFNSFLFHKSKPADKQHTYQSIDITDEFTNIRKTGNIMQKKWPQAYFHGNNICISVYGNVTWVAPELDGRMQLASERESNNPNLNGRRRRRKKKSMMKVSIMSIIRSNYSI